MFFSLKETVDMVNDNIAERELDTRCKIIYDLAKEVVENNTDANTRFFYWAYHETWMLKAFPKCLASKKAYSLFYNKYHKDIREFDWFSKETTYWKDDNNKRQFMHEHLTTSDDFKNELIYLYKKNELTVNKIKDLISQQRICWITREEDDVLRKTKTYKHHRPNPILAYKECGIEIYDAENEDLTNIMIPTFSQDGGYKNNIIMLDDEPLKNNSINLLEKIKNAIIKDFPNYCVHYSLSYIQIWKNTWNNEGKKGIHFELTPQKSRGFQSLFCSEQFYITFKLHNETNTCKLLPQIKNKTYFKQSFCFLPHSIESSIGKLIGFIHKIINIDENDIDLAHKI